MLGYFPVLGVLLSVPLGLLDETRWQKQDGPVSAHDLRGQERDQGLPAAYLNRQKSATTSTRHQRPGLDLAQWLGVGRIKVW